MAKIINSSIGQLSGKMGGMVFSRNKGGAYVRAGVTGINPQTIGQLQARNAFGAVSTLFRGLSSAEKTFWQEWADNYYSPRGGGNVGQFSGYNAFIALRSAVQQSVRLGRVGVLSVDGILPAGGTTTLEFTPMPETPIATTLLPAVKTTAGDSALLTLVDANVSVNGDTKIFLSVSEDTPLALDNIVDINGNELGFAVYISNGNPSDNMSYNNPEAHCLGFAYPIVVTDPSSDLAAVNQLAVYINWGSNLGRYKRFPLLNEYVVVTAYVINKYGMFSKIGESETKIIASIP